MLWTCGYHHPPRRHAREEESTPPPSLLLRSRSTLLGGSSVEGAMLLWGKLELIYNVCCSAVYFMSLCFSGPASEV